VHHSNSFKITAPRVGT